MNFGTGTGGASSGMMPARCPEPPAEPGLYGQARRCLGLSRRVGEEAAILATRLGTQGRPATCCEKQTGAPAIPALLAEVESNLTEAAEIIEASLSLVGEP